jgi:hypothetical protein
MLSTARGGTTNAICAAAKATIAAIASVGIAFISVGKALLEAIELGAGGSTARTTSTPIAEIGPVSGAFPSTNGLSAAPIGAG